MYLKKQPDNFRQVYNFLKQLFARYPRAAACIVVFSGLVLWFYAYSFIKYDNGIVEAAERISRVARGLMHRPEELALDIKFKHFQKILKKRKEALENHLLLTSSEDFVPATITRGSKKVRVKIRLKGDWVDHLKGKKWSYRVKVRDGQTLFGLREFSLQHPATRNYIYEWVFHKMLAHEGLIALKYTFLKLKINGEDKGVYALEGHFDKYLLESNNRREGPILRFNEGVFWDEHARHIKEARSISNPENFVPPASVTELRDRRYARTSIIDAFNMKRLRQDPQLFEEFLAAHDLLEAYRLNKLPASKVFDLKLMARYFAVLEIMGAHHSSRWHNMRFYYNPVTALFEPVGFDGNSGRVIEDILAESYKSDLDDIRARIFSDKEFLKLYMQSLERLSKKEYLDKFLKANKKEIDYHLQTLQAEFPSVGFTGRVLYMNQSRIRRIIDPTRAAVAYLKKKEEGQIHLQVGNFHTLPVELVGIKDKDGLVAAVNKNDAFLAGTDFSSPVKYQSREFKIIEEPKSAALKLIYKIYGTTKIYQQEIFPYRYFDPQRFKLAVAAKLPNFDEFSCLKEESNGVVTLKGRQCEINRDLVIPAGKRFYLSPGSSIDLKNNARIYLGSALIAEGEPDNPVRIFSSDKSGRGLAVINAAGESYFQYVTISGLKNGFQPGRNISGAVTFYNSPAKLTSIEFKDIQSEDALNIVNSTFEINKASFLNVSSDAFDSDFSNGVLQNCSFTKTGNDALDFSGSVVTLTDIKLSDIGDKAISAGEASKITAENVTVAKARLALVSKDLSRLSASKVSVSGSQYGFAAFQKKPEFGGGWLKVRFADVNSVNHLFLRESGSTILMDGKPVTQKISNVKEILYPAEE
ncbi:MAG: hypothetical protein D6719_06595 [Candidatus Dadabacteria bacterium]|nr:MAG: hypothetical protein D6719_06595 [Candidatus Dadabacteria bacterium]